MAYVKAPKFISDGDMSGDLEKVVSVEEAASFHASWTGTPEGTFELLASSDYDEADETSGNWETVPLDPPLPVGGGAAGSFLAEISKSASGWLKFKWANTSSTGTLNVSYVGKGSYR